MKKIKRTVSLLLSVVLTIAAFSIPAEAVSSGGLKTYYSNGSRFIAKTGLDYDIHIAGPTVGYFDSAAFNPGSLPHNYGVVRFNVGAQGASSGGTSISDFYPKTNWAIGTDYPRIIVTLDGNLIFDGAELAKQQTAELMQQGELGLHTVVSRYLSNSTISFDTRDLSVGTHTLVCTVNPDYMHEERNSSNNVSTVVFTIKGVPAAPGAPTLKHKTSTSVTVDAVSGQEYSINGGKTWQVSGQFTNLTPETTYQILTRIRETAAGTASAASGPLSVTTSKAAPDAPETPALQEKTAASITIQTTAGLEYSINSGVSWQASGTFSGLAPNTAYQITARVKATADMPCSEASAPLSVITNKQTIAAPPMPTLTAQTDAMITVGPVSGAEYSLNGGAWQDSPVFIGLSPDTEYSIAIRFKETSTTYASPASAALLCMTKKVAPPAPSRPVLQSSTDSTITVSPVTIL